jgi:hypothetical protein
MGDFMGTGLTKRQVEQLDANLTLGGAATLGLTGRLFEPWVEEWLRGEVPFEVTAEEFVTMFGPFWSEHFVAVGSCKFTESDHQSEAWFTWFYSLPEWKACEVVVTRLKALVFNAARSDLKPMAEEKIREIYE